MKRHLNSKKLKIHMSAATATQRKKVSVEIPASLNERIEAVVREQHTSLSILVREAVEKYLLELEDQKLEEAFRVGYAANAELAMQIHREFEFVDAEVSSKFS